MSQLPEIFARGINHHAYLLVGDPAFTRQHLREYLSTDWNVNFNQNPDVYFRIFDVLGIEASRELKAAAGKKSFGGQKKFFVLEVSFITREAQNALLKVFEEPGPNVCFFLLASRADIFLPTLRSRCEILHINQIDEVKKIDDKLVMAQDFLDQTLVDRFNQIDELAKDKTNLKSRTLKLLDGLEQVLYQSGLVDQAPTLRRIIMARRQLYSSGALPKIVLQDLALALK